MKKIFITGGTGTVGKAFIGKYYNDYIFYSFARNEKQQVSLKRTFPKIEIIMGGVENYAHLQTEISKVSPDIIIHAAALKHVDTAEKQPSQAIESNIIGSLNVIRSAINSKVKLTIGISTDKACSPDNVYGQSKYLMERMFLEADSELNRFVCCRFGNVAMSSGSVIPFWLTRKKESLPLLLTHTDMTRLMFSQTEAAELIQTCIEFSRIEGGFICSKLMKSVNMLELANLISDDIEVVGIRPGEKLYENLISESELPYTKIKKDNYILIKAKINKEIKTRLPKVLSSMNAEKMNQQQMLDLIDNVNSNFKSKLIDKKEY
jgi:UDP-N-acetylglucosamine 4,6-dehydratase/5-epimerase